MGDVIEVITQPTVIEVVTNVTEVTTTQVETATVEVLKGQQGEPGSSMDFYYVHTQVIPSSGWSINHNLGREPGVSLIIGGEEVDADVHHVDENTTYINFPSPQTGKAVLS